MDSLPGTIPGASDFVGALRRYVGALEYRPKKSCIVVETASGPRGFCDCAGLPLIGLRDIGLLPGDFDPNFPDAQHRETEILRVLRRLGRRASSKPPFKLGDVLVTGTPGLFHVMTVCSASDNTVRIIEAPTAHGIVCERPLDTHDYHSIRSAFRLFNG
ncbi:hypothetical protein EON83_20270 [bacterium]|nr:MAG: hypothetical protein EON83_20270 [bacterium]